MSEPLVSICIPSYEMNGKGKEFLERIFKSLENQTYKKFEIVVSDHSKDSILQVLCYEWSFKFDVKYLQFKEKFGSSSANANNCIKNSNGEIIKILCQDDYFYDKNSLEKTVKCFDNKEVKWVVSKYIHTSDGINLFNIHAPRWNDNILFNNSIGTHSCLSFLNDNETYFDENLIWFMDCELYHGLKIKYGSPFVLGDITFVQMVWHGAVTNSIINNDIIQKEKKYLKEKFNI